MLRGFSRTVTGDTLISAHETTLFCFERGHVDLKPVCFVSVEAESSKHESELIGALNDLALEDPSLQLITNEKQSGQNQLWGQGTLHLEV